jgi:hypothetical protein
MNASENALLRANILGFATQVKHATGAPDDQIPGLYKRAAAYTEKVMTKRAKLGGLILAQFAPAPAAPAAASA